MFAAEENLEFAPIGKLPRTGFVSNSIQHSIQSNCLVKSAIRHLIGDYPTTNVWPVDSCTFYATRGNILFRSNDSGNNWKMVRQLPSSSGSMGILPCAFSIHGDSIYVGEYPLNSTNRPRVLTTPIDGSTWETIATLDARHIHSVQVDPFTDNLWVTTGDADDESRIAILSDGKLNVVGGGSQLWRAVEIAFTPSMVLWGTDSPFSSSNHIVGIRRNELGNRKPETTVLHELQSPIYYAETLDINGTLYVFFSTAVEPYYRTDHEAIVICGSEIDMFADWKTLVSFQAVSPPLASLIPTNSYIYMATERTQGLLVNPFNTRKRHGEIVNIPPSYIRQAVK